MLLTCEEFIAKLMSCPPESRIIQTIDGLTLIIKKDASIYPRPNAEADEVYFSPRLSVELDPIGVTFFISRVSYIVMSRSLKYQ